MYIDVSLPAQRTYCVCFLGNNIAATSRMAVNDISGEAKKTKSTKVLRSSVCSNIFLINT